MKLSKRDEKILSQTVTFLFFVLGFYVYIKSNSLFFASLVMFGLIAFIIISLLIILHLQKNRLKKSGIHEIDQMDGFLFEKYLLLLFKAHGYNAKQTKSRGEFGADLILIKNGFRLPYTHRLVLDHLYKQIKSFHVLQ